MDASDSIFRPLAQQLSYLFDHKNKFQDLRSKVQDLKDARERVQQSVDSASRKGEVICDDVQRWLAEVNEKISDRATMQLLEDDEDAKMRSFAGCCPDFKSRYMLGKKAKKEADAITQLLTKKDAFNTVSYLPTVEEYDAFGSRSVAFDGVMVAMEDDAINIIGVEVAKRCVGLWIVIATIAKTLKPKENLFEWRDALRQLSKPLERNFKGKRADTYSATELSHKFLEGEEFEPIFLLSSILGHDVTVEDLLRHAIGLVFIHDVNMLEESRDRVLTLVNNLKASCLLLQGSRPTHFDMHDVVRDVVQSLASRDSYWLALFKKMVR
ncbi:hypothetical protein V6N12_057538 [Hibiscus sabdariffa]|uniref:Uncharacterized protein n=1 Tax=Hibiscus sabdariffa TaxID=183260 RepID=A0ABR2C5E8_9ROSI